MTAPWTTAPLSASGKFLPSKFLMCIVVIGFPLRLGQNRRLFGWIRQLHCLKGILKILFKSRLPFKRNYEDWPTICSTNNCIKRINMICLGGGRGPDSSGRKWPRPDESGRDRTRPDDRPRIFFPPFFSLAHRKEVSSIYLQLLSEDTLLIDSWLSPLYALAI